jgi:hypothetical protein
MNVDKFCIEKVMEVCAIILQLTYLNIWILSISRAPLVILKYSILKSLNETHVNFTVCGDMNIDYLIDSSNKKQLDTMLLSYNLISTVPHQNSK